MPNIAPIPREELSDYEGYFKIFENAIGFVPRSHYTMAYRPPIEKAFSELVLAVFGPGTVSAPLKQLVAMMSSVAAGCRYCQAHTSASAAAFGVSAEKVAAVFEFETSNLFSDAERAALRLARDAAIVPNATTPEHFDDLRKHFSEEQIVEILGSISLMGWLNRWNDTVATELEDEPLAFATEHLSTHGWETGKHRSGA